MAIKSATQLAAENTADFPDNTIGSITPAILRAFNQDMIDSTVGISPSFIQFSITVDFSVAGDTQINLSLPANSTRFRVNNVNLAAASGDISAATAGLFTQAAGAGIAVVTAASAISITTGANNTNNNFMGFAVNNSNTESYSLATVPALFFKVVGTAPQTAKLIVTIVPIP